MFITEVRFLFHETVYDAAVGYVGPSWHVSHLRDSHAGVVFSPKGLVRWEMAH